MSTEEERILQIAEILCDGYKDMPSGCEGCPLFERDIDEFDFVRDCPLYEIKKKWLTNK